jgi:xylulokinase
LWFKRHEPELFARTAKVMLPHDYVNYYLSGGEIFAMECGDASGMGLFKPRERAFDPDLMRYIDADLHSKLPATLVAPDACIGTVCRRVIDDLFPGFPKDKTICIAPGSGDNAMCALGSGVGVPGSSVVVSLGTSGTLFSCSEGVETDPMGYVAPFCDATGKWLPLTCVQNCTLVPDEVVSFAGKPRDELTASAAAEPPGCEGVFMLPYLSEMGERTPNWPHATGSIIGLRSGHLGRSGLLYRCALEGVAIALYRGYRRMLELGMTPPREMKLIGGGSSNDLWCQILSDVFQLPARRPRFADHAGALGAALQAAATSRHVAVGEYVHGVFTTIDRSGNEDALDSASVATEGQDLQDRRNERCNYDFVPNHENRSVYLALYRRHVAISDALYNNPTMRTHSTSDLL